MQVEVIELDNCGAQESFGLRQLQGARQANHDAIRDFALKQRQ